MKKSLHKVKAFSVYSGLGHAVLQMYKFNLLHTNKGSALQQNPCFETLNIKDFEIRINTLTGLI